MPMPLTGSNTSNTRECHSTDTNRTEIQRRALGDTKQDRWRSDAEKKRTNSNNTQDRGYYSYFKD